MATGAAAPPGGGGGRGRGPRYPVINFEDKAVAPSADEYDIEIVVFTSFDNRPYETDLDMYVDGNRVERVRTENDGRIRWTFQRVPANGFRNNGKVQVTAQIPGTTFRRSESINIPKPESKPKPVATKLRLDPDEGTVDPAYPDVKKYVLSIFVLTDEDKPVPGTKVNCSFNGISGVLTTPDDAGEILRGTLEVHGFGHREVF